MTDIETTIQPEAAAVHWHSRSTWVALAIILFYVVFTFVLPVIPLFIIFGTVASPFAISVAAVAGVIWLAAMAHHIFTRKSRKQLIWTAFRYGIISLGGTGIIVMLLSLSTPWHVRQNETFARQMRREADIPAIRAWAETTLFVPTPPPFTTGLGETKFYEGETPGCMKSITGFNFIAFSSEDKTVELVFGGGLGHWGLTIAPLGTKPPEGFGHYTLPLEDGAWVWQEMQ